MGKDTIYLLRGGIKKKTEQEKMYCSDIHISFEFGSAIFNLCLINRAQTNNLNKYLEIWFYLKQFVAELQFFPSVYALGFMRAELYARK